MVLDDILQLINICGGHHLILTLYPFFPFSRNSQNSRSMGIALALLFFFFPIVAQSQNTNFTFQGFNGRERDISLEGAQILDSGILRLTNRANNVFGRAFFALPIQMFNRSSSPAPTTLSFSTTFVFEMVGPSSGMGGYGLAFLLAPSTQLPGAEAGHYLGILNESNNGNISNKVIIVEFDTVNGFNNQTSDYKGSDNRTSYHKGSNNRMSDTRGNHVGIGINGLESNTTEPAAYHRGYTDYKEDMELEDDRHIQAWIEYDGEEKKMNVTICYAEMMKKPIKPLITFDVDLTDYIDESMYVGFSASTGKTSSYHYILGWSFAQNGEAPPLDISALARAPRDQESSSYNPQTVALISALCLVTVLLLGLLGFFLLRRRRPTSEILEDWEIDCPHRFRYKDLYAATKGFRESEVLGVGGFGAVYKGVLQTNGSEVAVKKITRNSLQGMREFAAEIESLGRLRHKNLVNLQGWCKQKNDLLLVYEYIPNGSLDSLLFNPKNGVVLGWKQRFNILKGIAAGLLYLHEEWEQVVIHRDVKSSNVLIDAEMNARLGDFGLARLYDHGEMSHTTNLVGTIGYIAPELTRTGKASASSDVYAYGILILELTTGKRPIGSSNFILVEWVRECEQFGQLLDVVDPSLNSNYVVKEMERVLQLGLLCSHQRQEFRPTMGQVMRCLGGEELISFRRDWSSFGSGREYKFNSTFLEITSSDTFNLSNRSSSTVAFSRSSMHTGR